MARPRKRPVSKAETQAHAMRAWIDRLPADVATAAMLGGIAAACGIIPPFTRLLQMTAIAGGGSSDDGGFDWAQILGIPTKDRPLPGIIGWMLMSTGKDNSSGQYIEPTEFDWSDWTLSVGMFCSGALEAAMMYNAMKSPEVVTTLIKAPAEMLKGIGEIVPG